MSKSLLLLILCWYRLYIGHCSSKYRAGLNRSYEIETSNSQGAKNFNFLGSRPSLCSSRDHGECPLGLFCNGTTCKCGEYPDDIIKCDEDKDASAILDCYCATFDESRGITEVGACIFNCVKWRKKFKHEGAYNPLQSRSTKNESLCTSFQRTGTLCGRCLTQWYPSAYSYNFTCVKCSHIGWNWGRYIMAAYLPLTLFCFAVFVFKINIVTSHLHPIVWYFQAFSMPAISCILLLATFYHPEYQVIVKTVLSLYGIWNFDFFRPFYSDICLGIGVLPTLALDYVIAMYPLFLMVVMYLLINLYDKNYRVIVIMWKPFRSTFMFFKRNWNIRTSVIDTIVTFLFLMNVKFLSVTFDLLVPTRLYKLYQDGYNQTNLVLYYSGDIEYFGKEHLPYAILAIILSLIFVVLPYTILALYPFAFFQKFLNCIPVRWHILHTFMDSFTGCYKDGTEPGTRDCRWFAAIFFLVRLVGSMIFAFTQSSAFYSLCTLLLLFLIILIINVQPFKPLFAHYTKINSTFFALLAMNLVIACGLDTAVIKIPSFIRVFYALVIISVITPVVYAAMIILHWIFSHKKSGLKLADKIKIWRHCCHSVDDEEQTLLATVR